MAKFIQGEDVVDIHGREIPTFIGPNKEIMCQLSDLKQTGFNIITRSEYQRLSALECEDSDFGDSFNAHMTEAANVYMLANNTQFDDNIITSSIESCKHIFKNRKATNTPQNILLNNREMEAGPDENFAMNVANPSPSSLQRFCHNKTDEEKGTNEETQAQAIWADKQTCSQTLKFNYNVEPKEVTVVVTAIHKYNCIWVRHVDKSEMFEAIVEKAYEEAASQKNAYKPILKQKVYMAKESESNWFRCKVKKYIPLTVFFLDCGTVAQVDEVREVSEELASTPSLAIRITFKAEEYTPRLNDTIRIRIFYKNQDGTFFVNIIDKPQTCSSPFSPKTPKSPTSPVKDSRTSTLNLENADRRRLFKDSKTSGEADGGNEDEELFEKPSYACRLEHGQRVAIVTLQHDLFYLRTRACFQKLRDIERTIRRCAEDAGYLREVPVKQLVLFRKRSDGPFYRAVASTVANDRFTVELLDHVGEYVTENLADFKVMDEDLGREPMTYFCGGRLVGFEDRELDQRAKDVIADNITNKKKFTVILGVNNGLDLYDGTRLLSQELADLPTGLANLSAEVQRIFLKDTKPYKAKYGTRSYICGYYQNSNDLAIVPSKKLQEHVDYIVRSDVADETPYAAEMQEVCLCFHGEGWYRCAVLEDCDTHYKMLLVDFGGIEIVMKEHVRKPDAKITQIPTLAMPCVLTGLPTHGNVESLLKQMIVQGELYNVEVKKFSEGKYHVEVPSVYKNIRN